MIQALDHVVETYLFHVFQNYNQIMLQEFHTCHSAFISIREHNGPKRPLIIISLHMIDKHFILHPFEHHCSQVSMLTFIVVETIGS